MIKNRKKILWTLVIILMIMPNLCMATDPISNPDKYNPSDQLITDSDYELVGAIANPIINTITIIGIITSVIVLAIIGIKYMVGSVAEKAEYKKTMIPYIIGVVMLIGIITILNVFSNIVNNVTSKI